MKKMQESSQVSVKHVILEVPMGWLGEAVQEAFGTYSMKLMNKHYVDVMNVRIIRSDSS